MKHFFQILACCLMPSWSAHCTRAEWKKELDFFPGSSTLQSKYIICYNKHMEPTRWPSSLCGGAITSRLTIGPRGPVLYPIKISLSLWERLQVHNEANKSSGSIHQGSNRSVYRSVCPRNLEGHMVTDCTQFHKSPTNQWIRMAVRNIALVCLEAQQAHQQQRQSQFLLAFCFPSRSLAWQYNGTWSSLTGESFQTTTNTRSSRSCPCRGGSSCCYQTEKKVAFKGWLVKCQTRCWAQEWHEVWK